jgi:hypothetical protein
MDTWEWIVLGVGIAIALLLALAFARIRWRRARLQKRFGSEYDRAVAQDGRGAGESQLAKLEGEHDTLELHDLPPMTRDRYLDEWRQAESRFVSDPGDAVRAAERIVERALHERGYPEGNGELASLVAVDHPDVAERYRHGHALLESVEAESTENLRKAMLDFRSVLEDVLSRPREGAAV